MNKKNFVIAMAVAAALAACGSKPVQPSWKVNAADALKGYSDAYLKGNTSIADTEFARARSEIASTGRPDLVAFAELVRCATRVAALEFDDCPGFAALADAATPGERAYAAYLAGRWQEVDAGLLPAQHQAVARVAEGQGTAVLTAIPDPLSRLVAAGALMKAGRLAPADIALATETASGQGWRRPLLVWLGVARKRAEAAGDTAEAARIQRRIDVALP
ncbi:hypothetical protein [Massilia cavernae]|uniref:Lipoprotein n=1 Tax=Massilia cavernae TaxID=2320864 RepID=A0A418XQA9_9BURK|nr:hypothetical protein [Massilia cavernae]RJG14654.1 hypothetical protein D3872_16930 [Massilia cavernae]